MKYVNQAILGAVLFLALLGSGCATFTDTPSVAEPGAENRYDDAGIKTDIASALLKTDAAKANDVNVHCYNGHVFLIGEADKEFRASALDIARKAQGVVHVTTHWFPIGTASTLLDAGIETDIDAKLFLSDDINARRVAIDVWGGHVVLTGLVAKQSEIDGAVASIRNVGQVKSVTSYLSLDKGLQAQKPKERNESKKANDFSDMSKKFAEKKASDQAPPRKRRPPHATGSE